MTDDITTSRAPDFISPPDVPENAARRKRDFSPQSAPPTDGKHDQWKQRPHDGFVLREYSAASPHSSSSSDKSPRPESAPRTRRRAFNRLREHSQFGQQNAENLDASSAPDEVSAAQEILLSHTVVESDREPLFDMEILRLFRQRLRVLAVLGILLLPFFHLFYAYLSPTTAQQALVPHGLMLATCALYLFFAPRIPNLMWARLLTVAGYILICTGASLMMANLSQSSLEDAATRNAQFVVLAAHAQILLSVVMLPLVLWEGAVMAGIVAGSLVWSAWWTLSPDASPMRSAQIFVLCTTAVFVLCIAHFQSLLRRRAFDAAFDLARSAAQLQALSIHDAVTGGFNRLYLEKTLTLEINRAARFRHPLSLIMFDLDNFKTVNDTRGHPVGDEVLRVVWQASAAVVREVDTAARYGGDEFMIVLPETETPDAHEIAVRLQAATRDQLTARFGGGVESAVTLSIGIVTLHPDTPPPLEHVISLADERLYEAKRSGKNQIAS